MTTRQAEEILKHTFKQLEKMLNDELRKKNAEKKSSAHRRQSHKQTTGTKTTGTTGGSENHEK